MPHSSSPLELVQHRFLAFECHATEDDNATGALSLRTQPEISMDPDDPLSWKVVLSVEFSPEDPEQPSTYRGLVKVRGEFRINESFKEENREALIRVTAVSILYGSCRELIANFTARSLNGILSLPSISFRAPKQKASGTDSQPG